MESELECGLEEKNIHHNFITSVAVESIAIELVGLHRIQFEAPAHCSASVSSGSNRALESIG